MYTRGTYVKWEVKLSKVITWSNVTPSPLQSRDGRVHGSEAAGRGIWQVLGGQGEGEAGQV